jgi:hypothetical protein
MKGLFSKWNAQPRLMSATLPTGTVTFNDQEWIVRRIEKALRYFYRFAIR